MTLILDLPEELEARLRAVARANGTDEAEAARQVLESGLPPAPALLKKSAFGKYAGLGPSVEEFLREKHAEIAREEADFSKDHQAA